MSNELLEAAKIVVLNYMNIDWHIGNIHKLRAAIEAEEARIAQQPTIDVEKAAELCRSIIDWNKHIKDTISLCEDMGADANTAKELSVLDLSQTKLQEYKTTIQPFVELARATLFQTKTKPEQPCDVFAEVIKGLRCSCGKSHFRMKTFWIEDVNGLTLITPCWECNKKYGMPIQPHQAEVLRKWQKKKEN